MGERMGLKRVALAANCLSLLKQYTWPGNVRELEHAVYRATIIARATQQSDELLLEAQHFNQVPEQMVAPPVALDVPFLGVEQGLREATDDFQRQLIDNTLNNCARKWSACARMLDMDVANLHRLAKRLGLK